MQDMQAEKLQEQLRNMLMERKREAKKAFDMAGAWSKDAASRPAGRLAKKGDDATIKVRYYKAGGTGSQCRFSTALSIANVVYASLHIAHTSWDLMHQCTATI